MTLNYKHRFVLAIFSYTFVLILAVLAAFWLIFEQIEESDNKNPPFWMNPNITMALKRHAIDHAEHAEAAFTIYSTRDSLPKHLQRYDTYGVHLLDNQALLVIGQHSTTKENYYLLINQSKEISFWEDEQEDIIFVFLTAILLTISMVFLILYMAKKLTSPVIELQEKVRNIDINSEQLTLLDREDEVGQLSRHFSDLITRMRQFALRERDFTRFSSHELRTPVTVIRGNLDLLDKTIPKTDINIRIMKRMNIATTRMSNLIDMFLCLSREGDVHDTFPKEQISTQSLHDILNSILLSLSPQEKERISIDVQPIDWFLSPVMLAIVVDNLLRNALCHGVGNIEISIKETQLTLSNQRIQNSTVLSKGIGLQIVQNICKVNDWQLHIQLSDLFYVELEVNRNSI